jgi:hypothetical protein
MLVVHDDDDPVTAAFILLGSLIAITPILVIAGGVLVDGCLLFVTSTMVALVALTMHPGELRRFTELVKPVAIVLAIPCIWMLIQIAPLPSRSLINPAWLSTSIALGKPVIGTISLDIGATLLSLARYCFIAAIAIVTTAVALDRQRADNILSMLTAITTCIAAALIPLQFGYLHFFGLELSIKRADPVNIAVIGLILTCATAIRAYERYEMRRDKNGGSTADAIAIAPSGIAFVICLSAIMIDGDGVLLFSALCGVSVLITVSAIRRLRLGPWGHAGIAGIAIVVAVGFFSSAPATKDLDLTLALSNQTHIAVTERMLSDVNWAGSGAGTFEALLPIYRDVDDTYSYELPTAAAWTAIEMGRLFLWGGVILAAIAALTLFRRALLRGRDYIYAGTGAACIVALLVSFFSNAGTFGLSESFLISVVYGLALAQSRSWNTQAFAGGGH